MAKKEGPMFDAMPNEKVRCTCGEWIVISQLKAHVQKSFFHLLGKGWRDNAIPPEELDKLAKEILAAAVK